MSDQKDARNTTRRLVINMVEHLILNYIKTHKEPHRKEIFEHVSTNMPRQVDKIEGILNDYVQRRELLCEGEGDSMIYLVNLHYKSGAGIKFEPNHPAEGLA